MKSCILLLITGFVALSSALPSFDLKFQSQQQKQAEEKVIKKVLTKLFEPHLPHHQPVYHFWKWGVPHTRLMKFKWSDCGNSSSIVIFKDLKLTPDPVVLPGSITASVDIELKEDIKDSLTADITMEKIIDSFHLKIPCLNSYGSCHYEDLCAILFPISKCPDILDKNNIPCHCPFKKGSYILPPSVFRIDTDPVPSGYYTLKAVLTRKKTFVGCLSLGVGFSA